MNKNLVEYSSSICILGPISVGKSTLIKKFESILVEQNPGSEGILVQPSIMAELTRVLIPVQGDKKLRTLITDTPGMKKLFNAIPPNILRNHTAYIVVYDMTDRETFKDIKEWFGPVKEYAGSFSEIVLLANKNDDPSRRVVSQEEGMQLALLMNAKYFETSSKTGNNVSELFTTISNNIINKVKFGTLNVNNPQSGLKWISGMQAEGSSGDERLRVDKSAGSSTSTTGCCW